MISELDVGPQDQPSFPAHTTRATRSSRGTETKKEREREREKGREFLSMPVFGTLLETGLLACKHGVGPHAGQETVSLPSVRVVALGNE